MKTKIPVKKYVPPEPRLMETITLLTMYPPNPTDGECDKAIAYEYKRLLAHHEEETKFLISKIEELEALPEKIADHIERFFGPAQTGSHGALTIAAAVRACDWEDE